MKTTATGKTETAGLRAYLNPLAVWAIAVGSSVGWGSLVITSSTYLAQAGPLGTVLGLLLGMALMLVISRNFACMAGRYPDAGGVYAYTREVFGYDRAFLISWFLSLTYISILWANATAFPLFARIFLGDLFRFGYLYTVFGYEVYAGEALLTLAAIAAVTLLCIRSRHATAVVMVVLSLLFTAAIALCFVGTAGVGSVRGLSLEPAFLPDGRALSQILRITFISPWAFIGFENVTHSAEEYAFRRDKLFRILVIAVVSTTALYIFITLMSVSAYPPEYDCWLAYIRDLGNLSGVKALPAFYAAEHYLGVFGPALLIAALFALIMTSLIGNLRALSRLFYAVAKDEILPPMFAGLNGHMIPEKAMLLAALISLPIPFVGRTAIGWIVDVTTIGATLLYGFVSAAALKTARQRGSRTGTVTGAVGLVMMLAFGVYLLFPNIFSDDTLETETYILFIVWSILGFLYFRRIIAKDHARRFGKAIIVWIVLLALVVFMSMIWTGRVDEKAGDDAIRAMQSYYTGTADPAAYAEGEEAFIARQMESLHRSSILNTLVVAGLFVLALGAMLINHFSMRKWEAQTASERDRARAVAYTDPLTGVKSKNAFAEKEAELAERIAAGEQGEFGVVVCDVNGLKHVNDTQGHQAGDRYIRAASELICEYFKHSPVFRTGGDEFVITLEGQDFQHRGKILAALNRAVEDNIPRGEVVISLGLAEYGEEAGESFRAVFQRADDRMYRRKLELKGMGAVTRE